MISARIELNEYSNKVFNVIKARYDLKDKSEAINKLAELCGDEFAPKDADEEYVKKLIRTEENHLRKYGKRQMSLEELDKLCGDI